MTPSEAGTSLPNRPWPTPLPKWVWPWMRWALGEGEYRKHGPKKGARPDAAPPRIPGWAWQRLEALVAMRSAEKPETPDVPQPGPPPHPPPAPTPHQRLMAARRLVVAISLEIAKRPEQGHYSQARPAEHTRDHVTLAQVKAGKHWTGDCSSTVGDWIPRLAGLDPAPSGPWTNTWRIGSEWPRVTIPALGDAVLYNGHVVGIIGFRNGKPTADLDDVYVFSHGSEAGPYGYPASELAAGYRDDFMGFHRHPSLITGADL